MSSCTRILALTASLAALPLTAAPAQNREIDLEWLRNAGTLITGQSGDTETGQVVSGAGDFNGDGVADVMTASIDTGFFADPGKVYLFYGGASLPESLATGAADVVINGLEDGDEAGASLAALGDIDGDGNDEILVGVPRVDAAGTDSGAAYLIWGDDTLPPSATIDLSSLGSAGVVFTGADFSDLAGSSVAGPGDMSGDGVPDLLIGARGASPVNLAGSTYLVFGSPSLSGTVDLGSLGAGGVTINGIDASDESATSLSGAGDFDDDGINDCIIGAPRANPNGNDSGQAYIIYGRDHGSSPFPGTISLGSLGSLGVSINGAIAGDRLGNSVSGGGDVDGDGHDDVIVGADNVDVVSNEGRAYVVYGRDAAGGADSVEVSSLGSAGVTFTGINQEDEAGEAVALGGDTNRDGLADILISAWQGDPGGNARGEVYLIPGSASLPSSLDLDDIDELGVQLNGVDNADRAGSAVAFVGDVFDDGFDDYMIGARFADNSGGDTGECYVVKGNCHWMQAAGTLGIGDTFTFRIHGPPSVNFMLLVSFAVFPTAFETNKGPYWLDGGLGLIVVPHLANGETTFPLTIPNDVGIIGANVYWQGLNTPQGNQCDLTQLVAMTITS